MDQVIKMKSKKRIIGILLMMWMAATIRARAQSSEIVNLLRDFEARAAAGTPPSYDEAEPVIERFAQASKESVTEALPIILQETTSPYVSIRRVAAMSLYLITNRPEGQALLATQISTFAALLIDTDIPIRRITGLALANLHLNDTSPLLTNLEAYLSREDATSTIGGGVAGLLMKAAPDNAESSDAIVRYMGRKDHTAVSRIEMMQSIEVTRSHNREIGKAVANWADAPDEQTSVHAIRTLQGMGKDVVLDSQQSLSRIAADTSRAPSERTAATKALAAVQ
jgi:hypothetical protein